MKYLVMECHFSYVIVLDENGCFRKAINQNYEVGQTLTNILELDLPEEKAKTNKHIFRSLAAVAACLILVITSFLHIEATTYASVYLSINPEIRIDVNRRDKVVTLEGINNDGQQLIERYDFKRKNLDTVTDELLEKAIDMGYLHEGGEITLILDAKNETWISSHSATLCQHIQDYLSGKITATVEVKKDQNGTTTYTIPVAPGDDSNGNSDYGNSDYGSTDYGNSDYGNSDYSSSANTDYDNSNYNNSVQDTPYTENSDEGNSDYNSNSNYNISDNNSNYNDSDYADGED